MRKKLLKEYIDYSYNRDRDIDPFDEENWNEHEIKTGDILYFFGSKDENIFTGTMITNLKNNELTGVIKKCTENSLINKKIFITEQIKNQLNDNHINDSNILLDDNNIIMILVCDFSFYNNYNIIQESIRKKIYDPIKELSYGLHSYEKKLDEYENNITKLKRNIKYKKEFPNPKYLKIGLNEYIVIKYFKNENNSSEIEMYITELSDPDDNNGYNLIDKSNNKKIVYLKDTFKKLKENGYLLLKSKKYDSKKTYITKNLDLYKSAIENLINLNNGQIDEEINEYRKLYIETIDKIKEMSKKLEELRLSYQKFSFSKIVNELKKLID